MGHVFIKCLRAICYREALREEEDEFRDVTSAPGILGSTQGEDVKKQHRIAMVSGHGVRTVPNSERQDKPECGGGRMSVQGTEMEKAP